MLFHESELCMLRDHVSLNPRARKSLRKKTTAGVKGLEELGVDKPFQLEVPETKLGQEPLTNKDLRLSIMPTVTGIYPQNVRLHHTLTVDLCIRPQTVENVSSNIHKINFIAITKLTKGALLKQCLLFVVQLKHDHPRPGCSPTE